MRRSLGVSLVFACLWSLPACSSAPDKSDAPGYKQLYSEYFHSVGGCGAVSCHGGEKGIAGLSFDDEARSYDLLVGHEPTNGAARTAGLKRVTAGDLDKSLLYWKLNHAQEALTTAGYGAMMPIGGSGAPGARTRDAVARWIQAGAPRDGASFTADLAGDTGNGDSSWTKCDATDEAGMRACFPVVNDQSALRLYTPPITVPPQSEVFMCSYLDTLVSDDALISAVKGAQMVGGHHAAVFVALSPQSNHEPHECTNEEMGNFRFFAAAGGQGGQDTKLPADVALKLKQGWQMVVQSHYHNTTEQEHTVMDAVDLVYAAPDRSYKLADPFVVLDSEFTIPSHQLSFMREKICTLDHDMDIYTILGHTHENGILFTVDLLDAAGNATELYHATDGKLLKNSPEIKWFDDPLQFKAGDKVRLRCTWENPTDHEMVWPEEMCVTLMYYAPGSGYLICDTEDDSPKVAGGSGDLGCVGPGTGGNDKGVGKFCTVDGSECSDNGSASFCLATFDDNYNFCTFIGCMVDADCGTDAFCALDPKGSACVPNSCQ